MRGLRIPAGFSDLVIVRKVEQRFGLIGFARLFKLVELVAEREGEPKRAQARLSWGDVLEALGCAQDAALEFLRYCEQAQVLERIADDGHVQLTLRGDLAGMLGESPAASLAGPVLFIGEQQWVDWFLAEWSCPPYVVDEPATRQLFRRWIATNVTVDEVMEATQLALAAREAPIPTVLHDHLKTVRAAKIKQAVA